MLPARRILHHEGFTVKEHEVIAVEVEDCPGGLAKILGVFCTADISVEYMYAFVKPKTDRAVMIFRVASNAKAIKDLQDSGISLLSDVEVYRL